MADTTKQAEVLTEEELKELDLKIHKKTIYTVDIQKVISSHRALAQENKQLKEENEQLIKYGRIMENMLGIKYESLEGVN